MTTEDDFQSKLDACPDDHHTRLIFADWLDDHSDARAAGYRALGQLSRRPRIMGVGWLWQKEGSHLNREYPTVPESLLPSIWFAALQNWNAGNQKRRWKRWLYRREAEDAAALAFVCLAAKRRTELLNPKRKSPA